MAVIAWILSFACLMGGLAVYQAPFFVQQEWVMKGLFAAAFILCPGLCGKDGFFGFVGLTGGQRVAACLAGILALPSLFI